MEIGVEAVSRRMPQRSPAKEMTEPLDPLKEPDLRPKSTTQSPMEAEELVFGAGTGKGEGHVADWWSLSSRATAGARARARESCWPWLAPHTLVAQHGARGVHRHRRRLDASSEARTIWPRRSGRRGSCASLAFDDAVSLYPRERAHRPPRSECLL